MGDTESIHVADPNFQGIGMESEKEVRFTFMGSPWSGTVHQRDTGMNCWWRITLGNHLQPSLNLHCLNLAIWLEKYTVGNSLQPTFTVRTYIYGDMRHILCCADSSIYSFARMITADSVWRSCMSEALQNFD